MYVKLKGFYPAPPMKLPVWTGAQVKLPDGRMLYIRTIQESDIKPILGYLEEVHESRKRFL